MITQNYTILYCLLFSLSLLLNTGCKDKEDKSINRQIQKALELGINKPTQALQILDSVDVNSLDGTNYMLYQIADVKATRNVNFQITPQQVDLITQAATYFEKQNNPLYAGLANYYAAIAYNKNNNLPQGFSHYVKAYLYSKAANDSLIMGKSLYNQSIMYYQQEVYDSATVNLKKCIPILKNAPQIQVQAYQMLASTNYITCNYDSILNYLDTGFPLLDPHKDRYMTTLYNNMYGTIYTEKKEYSKAAAYLLKNMGEEVDKTEQLRSGLNLLRLYTTAHKLDSATRYKNQIMPLFGELQSQKIKILDDHYLLFLGYRVIWDYYKLQNNKDSIAKYADLHADKNREIDEFNLSNKFLNIKNKLDIQEMERINKKYNQKIFIYTLSTSLLLFAIALFFIRKQIKRKEKKTINRIKEIDDLRTELRKMIDNEKLKPSVTQEDQKF